jgi:Conserved TM helix/Mechanosensitive ion channel
MYIDILSFFTDLANGVGKQYMDGLIVGIPRVISAIMIFIIGQLAAKFVRKVLTRALSAVGIDKFGAKLNNIEFVQQTGTNIQLSALISQVVYFMMMLMILIVATDALHVEAISKIVKDFFEYMPNLLTAGLVLLAGLYLADLIRGVFEGLLASMGISSAKMIGVVVFYFLFVSIFIGALTQAKINTDFISANLTVIIGAVALAFAFGYGLASRDLVANFLAGYYNRNKVRLGDDVRISGERGKVVLIDSTSLILQTPERAIIIPLAKLTNEKVEVFYPDAGNEPQLGTGQ